MTSQPVLNRTPFPLDGVRYTVSYHRAPSGPDDTPLEDLHIHDCYELYFNLSGDVSFLVNNRLYAVRSGDVIFTRPGELHLCVLERPCVHEHYCLWVSCAEGSAQSELLCRIFPGTCRSFGAASGRLADLFDRVFREPDGLGGTAAFLSLLGFCEGEGGAEDAPARSVMPPAMQEIVDDIDEHFAEIGHVRDILARSYISQATLNRWFRKYLHLSPREFLEARKLASAKMLLGGSASVTEACMRAGFPDCSHFIAVFKKHFGETPLHYKKRMDREQGRSGRKRTAKRAEKQTTASAAQTAKPAKKRAGKKAAKRGAK